MSYGGRAPEAGKWQRVVPVWFMSVIPLGITKWCKDYFDAVHPDFAGGDYVNFMMDEGQERGPVVIP